PALLLNLFNCLRATIAVAVNCNDRSADGRELDRGLPAKASVVELELRMRRSEPASALVRRSEPTSALVSAANHTFWIIVLAILSATASGMTLTFASHV